MFMNQTVFGKNCARMEFRTFPLSFTFQTGRRWRRRSELTGGGGGDGGGGGGDGGRGGGGGGGELS